MRLRRYYLARVARHIDLMTAGTEELEKWLAAQTWKNETARSVRSTLRGFYAWLYERGKRPDNPTLGLAVIRELPPNPHPLPEDAYAQALREAPARWRIAIRLAGEAGLRRSEVAQISEGDIFKDLFGWSLHIHGKGGKERDVPLNDSLALEVRLALRGQRWLFPAVSSSGHITSDYLARRVREYLPRGWSMHSLRHRFATVAYAATNDIRAVQELLGHANLNTTQRYVAVTRDRLRAVAVSAAQRAA